MARNYLKAVTTVNVPAQGRSGVVTSRLLRALARDAGQSATYKTLVDNMYGPEDIPEKPTPRTVNKYMDMLDSFYLIEQIPGWAPSTRSPKRFQIKGKRYFTDPSLMMTLPGMNPESPLRDFQAFGLVFENLCVHDLLVYAHALPGTADEPLRYYRDDTELEIDVIIK